MTTMNFKTNAKCGGCVSAIGEKLNKILKADEWSINLSDPDKVLRVTTSVTPETIIAAVAEAGFRAEQLL